MNLCPPPPRPHHIRIPATRVEEWEAGQYRNHRVCSRRNAPGGDGRTRFGNSLFPPFRRATLARDAPHCSHKLLRLLTDSRAQWAAFRGGRAHGPRRGKRHGLASEGAVVACGAQPGHGPGRTGHLPAARATFRPASGPARGTSPAVLKKRVRRNK